MISHDNTEQQKSQEREFLEGLVGEALRGSTSAAAGELGATKDGYPQLAAFAKHGVMSTRLGNLGVRLGTILI